MTPEEYNQQNPESGEFYSLNDPILSNHKMQEGRRGGRPWIKRDI